MDDDNGRMDFLRLAGRICIDSNRVETLGMLYANVIDEFVLSYLNDAEQDLAKNPEVRLIHPRIGAPPSRASI